MQPAIEQRPLFFTQDHLGGGAKLVNVFGKGLAQALDIKRVLIAYAGQIDAAPDN
jgi:hypothetical protein